MTHFSLTALPAIRYASDMPFSVGMVLADDEGRTVEVQVVTARLMMFSAPSGIDSRVYSHGFVRARFPYLVFVTGMVADAEAREAERVEALAERAQWEDDLRNEVLDHAAAEWKRKNRDMTMEEAALAHTVPFAKANNNCVQDAQWRLRDALKLAGQSRTAHELAPSYVQKAVRDLRSWL